MTISDAMPFVTSLRMALNRPGPRLVVGSSASPLAAGGGAQLLAAAGGCSASLLAVGGRALSLCCYNYFLTLREYLMNFEVEKSLRIASFGKIFLCTGHPDVGSCESSLVSFRHVRTSFLSSNIKFFFWNLQLKTNAKNSFA